MWYRRQKVSAWRKNLKEETKIGKQQFLAVSAQKLAAVLLLGTPFLAGGFFVWTSALVSLVLLGWLALNHGKFGLGKLRGDWTLIAAGVLPLAFLLGAPFAVDRGQAVMGFVKYLPLPLFCLLLRCIPCAERKKLWNTVPLGETAMTLLSAVLLCIPQARQYLLVNGRLGGFFQYPNTYAAYLLCGIVCLLNDWRTEGKQHTADLLQLVVLATGILFSGSRTALILLVVVMLAALLHAPARRLPLLCGIVILVVGYVGVLLLLGKGAQLMRYLVMPWQSSTFLGRLLYWKDAAPVILQHPFGLGYLGYYFLQGSFQTGVYATRYVHNELLQLLLDVGWLPTALALIALIAAWKQSSTVQRWLLVVMIGHAMMDFDFQFLAMDLLLLLVIDHDQVEVETETSRAKKYVGCALGIAAAGIALAAGLSDVFLQFSHHEAALACWPGNTDALLAELADADSVPTAAAFADRILAVNPHCAAAYNAKAYEAFAAGDGESVIAYQNQAIAYARYDITQYETYLDMLATLYSLYQQAGMAGSAEIVRAEILRVPDLLAEVESETSLLAWEIADIPELELPEPYQQVIEQLKH